MIFQWLLIKNLCLLVEFRLQDFLHLKLIALNCQKEYLICLKEHILNGTDIITLLEQKISIKTIYHSLENNIKYLKMYFCLNY
jgi:hypothetical protein